MCRLCYHTEELHRPTLAPDTTNHNRHPFTLTPGGVPLPPPPRHVTSFPPPQRHILSFPQSPAGLVPPFSQLPIGPRNSLGLNLPPGVPSNASTPIIRQFQPFHGPALSTARDNRKISIARMNSGKPGKRRGVTKTRTKIPPPGPVDEVYVLFFPLNVRYSQSSAIIDLNPFIRLRATPNPSSHTPAFVQNLLWGVAPFQNLPRGCFVSAWSFP